MKKYFLLFTFYFLLLLTACGTAPVYQPDELVQANNEYANINSARPVNEDEKKASAERWDTARIETRWQEYRGQMVRVEILLGDNDLREMRLRMIQSADGMDVDGDARTILARVADFEMKKVCGRNADSIVIVYDKPSMDVMRSTPYFDYRTEASGASMREYGFRCVYNN